MDRSKRRIVIYIASLCCWVWAFTGLMAVLHAQWWLFLVVPFALAWTWGDLLDRYWEWKDREK